MHTLRGWKLRNSLEPLYERIAGVLVHGVDMPCGLRLCRNGGSGPSVSDGNLWKPDGADRAQFRVQRMPHWIDCAGRGDDNVFGVSTRSLLPKRYLERLVPRRNGWKPDGADRVEFRMQRIAQHVTTILPHKQRLYSGGCVAASER